MALAPGWETAAGAAAKWCGDGVAPTETGCTFPRIFASSSQSTTANTPQNAFDGATTTGVGWVSAALPSVAAPQILGVQFAVPVIINQVSLFGRLNGNRAYNPSDYTIETSDTGADGSWTAQATLSSAAPATTWPITTAKTDAIVTSFAPPLVATWIRVNITQTYFMYAGVPQVPPTANSTQICELQIR